MKALVIGGGISGLSLAYLLKRQSPEMELAVLESAPRTGGKIWTERHQGYLLEGGVNGFLDSKPSTLELCDMVGAKPVRSYDASRKRFICHKGTLHRLPEGPGAFLKTGLVSIPGKLRIALEPFISKYSGDDESLASFARRRLGSELYERFIDPMASGIFAGDPEQMSLKSCFPRIHELEQAHGSLIRAMVHLMRERKKQVNAAPAGKLTSFLGGMQTLTEALRATLGEDVKVKARVVGIARAGREGYSVHLSDGSRVEAQCVVLAVPAHEATKIVKDLDKQASDALADIPYPPLSVVCMGFRQEKFKEPLDAFGFLVPSGERKPILGTLYDTSIFPERSPEGFVLLRSMIGGARASELAMADDKALHDYMITEVRQLAGVRGEPDFFKVYRHEKAIPQYTVGHSDKLKSIEGASSRHPGLYITGNALRGVSVNDCIVNSFDLARRIIEEVA